MAVLNQIAVEFVGGRAYAEIGSLLWAFAALGTLLAMLQVMVYDAVARQNRKAVYLVWAAFVAVLCAIPFVSTVTQWLTAVSIADASALVLLLLTLRPSRDRVTDESQDAASLRRPMRAPSGRPRASSRRCPPRRRAARCSSVARPICSRTNASSASASPVATSNT